MYERYVFKDRNQNLIPALIQEVADFLMQIGEDLSYAGRVLARIGQDPGFDTDKRLSDEMIQSLNFV
jgi:hypothetical protein